VLDQRRHYVRTEHQESVRVVLALGPPLPALVVTVAAANIAESS
jgi:hypothetical protein